MKSLLVRLLFCLVFKFRGENYGETGNIVLASMVIQRERVSKGKRKD